MVDLRRPGTWPFINPQSGFSFQNFSYMKPFSSLRKPTSCLSLLLFFKCSAPLPLFFIHFWLHRSLLLTGFPQLWRAGAALRVHGLLVAVVSLVAEHKLQAHGLQQLQLKGSVVVVHRLCCSTACRIFLGSNLCPRHWQADSYPLGHQGFCLSLFFDSLATGPQNFKEVQRDMSTGSREADRAQPFPTQHPPLLAYHLHASPGQGLVMSMLTVLVLCPFLTVIHEGCTRKECMWTMESPKGQRILMWCRSTIPAQLRGDCDLCARTWTWLLGT